LDAYERACAVSSEHSLPVLEAVHIRPYALGGEHAVSNGLSLRSDIHRLFDRGYVTLDDELRLVVSPRLKHEFDNGRSYFGYQGQPIRVPLNEADLPSRSALEWHREVIFRG
jgi:putative restriction endonuclease